MGYLTRLRAWGRFPTGGVECILRAVDSSTPIHRGGFVITDRRHVKATHCTGVRGVVLTLPWALTWLLSGAGAADTVRPFKPGEKLSYCFYWAGVPVGDASGTVHQDKEPGKLKLVLSARTNAWIDKLYLVRLRWTSTVDQDKLTPYRLIMTERENHRRSQYVVEFDRAKKVVRCTKKRFDKDKTRHYVFGNTTAYDALSTAYALRVRDLKPGQKFSIDAITGKRLYRIALRVVSKVDVTIKAGTFAALYIEAQPRRIKPPPKPKDQCPLIRLWVSADQRRVPVKVSASTRWAALSGELVTPASTPKKSASAGGTAKERESRQ